MNTARPLHQAHATIVTEHVPSLDDALKTKARYMHKGIPMFLQQAAALTILLCLSPVLLLIAIFIKLESQGPVLFAQDRVGEFGRQFRCYKLRSMHVPGSPQYKAPVASSSDRDGICQKFYHDPRITRIGKYLRKYSVDELPQLINVVKGDMAMIGPRPHLVSEYCQYNRQIMPRLYCKPGLTGLWQVSGRADTTFEEQLNLDKRYIVEQSVWTDMKILALTVPAVLAAKGAY